MKINFRKKVFALALISAISLSAVGCTNKNGGDDKSSKKDSQKTEQKAQKSATSTTKDKYTFDNNDYYTSISWLEKNKKSNKNLVIIDARDIKEYKKGHIPGAIDVAWQSLSKMSGKAGDKDWGTLQDKNQLSVSLGKLGISENSKVVVYAQKDAWGEDGRVVWSLKRAGVDARMLNGGIDLWNLEKKETTKDVPKITPTKIEIKELKPEMNITTSELKKDIKNLKVIDTRSKEEYNGAVKFGEARGGHLPGAINIPFTELYNQDGTVKTNDEIVKILEKAGIKKDDNVVTYCTAGIRSAYMALAMKNAGFDKVRNYDASFYEWAGDKTNKLEK